MASSSEKQKQPKIPTGSYPREEVVNPRGPQEAPSFSPARPTEPIREAHCIDLMEQVVERGNLLSALHRVEKNKGAAGVDGMEIKSLRPFLMEHWERIRSEILRGTYQPSPVRRVEILKPDGGGVRLLGIPTVLDRLLQQAIQQVLTSIFDPEFSPYSYGFRSGYSAHDAVKQAQSYIAQGYRFVVDMDLAQFFDRVNHRAETRSVFVGLDEWLRRRLRMCLLKQWKKSRTKRRKLVGLGVPEEWARKISGSRKGYWRLALTPQMNKALGLAYWRDQGLVSLVERYDALRSTT